MPKTQERTAPGPRDAGEYFELGEGEWIYISPRGKLHWPGCRYYKPMGPKSLRVVFEIGPEFWEDACKFCDPDRENRELYAEQRRLYGW